MFFDIVLKFQLLILVILSERLFESSANSVQVKEGWKMVDRFYGFRYELLNCSDLKFEEHIKNLADNMGCFGWIQRLPVNAQDKLKLVGEGRCSKKQGPLFQSRIRDDCKLASGAINHKILYNDLVYADTKIRLHFSAFKILPSTRDTCFLDSPHKCDDNLRLEDDFNSHRNDEL